jgi:hypothetical protein
MAKVPTLVIADVFEVMGSEVSAPKADVPLRNRPRMMHKSMRLRTPLACEALSYLLPVKDDIPRQMLRG